MEKRWEASDTQLINCECCLGTRDVRGSRQQEQQQRQGLPLRPEHTPSENDTYYRRRRRHRTTRAASALKTNRCRIFLDRVREGADADGRAQTTTNKGLRMTAPEAEAPMLFCRRPACRYFRNNKKNRFYHHSTALCPFCSSPPPWELRKGERQIFAQAIRLG